LGWLRMRLLYHRRCNVLRGLMLSLHGLLLAMGRRCNVLLRSLLMFSLMVPAHVRLRLKVSLLRRCLVRNGLSSRCLMLRDHRRLLVMLHAICAVVLRNRRRFGMPLHLLPLVMLRFHERLLRLLMLRQLLLLKRLMRRRLLMRRSGRLRRIPVWLHVVARLRHVLLGLVMSLHLLLLSVVLMRQMLLRHLGLRVRLLH
jgi:hypothetical protein